MSHTSPTIGRAVSEVLALFFIIGKLQEKISEVATRMLEHKELVLHDKLATELALPNHCWVCKE